MNTETTKEVEPRWKQAAEWLRNNYQDFPNVDSLVDAMLSQDAAASPKTQEGPSDADNEDAVADLLASIPEVEAAENAIPRDCGEYVEAAFRAIARHALSRASAGAKPAKDEEVLRLHLDMAGLRLALDRANERAASAAALSNHLQDRLAANAELGLRAPAPQARELTRDEQVAVTFYQANPSAALLDLQQRLKGHAKPGQK